MSATAFSRMRLRRARADAALPVRGALARIGVSIVVLWILLAVAAPLVAPHDPLAQTFERFQAPSAAHLFGTDELGRDVLSRVIFAARVSLPLAALTVAIVVTAGSIVGGVAGYFGGWLDGLLMRLTELVLAFPAIVLAMGIAAALGPSLRNAVLAVALVSWPAYARVVRSLVLSLKTSNFVLANRMLGSSSWRALRVDVLPNVVSHVLVLGALDLGRAVLLLASLSFLGLGALPPTAEWGAMISSGAANFDKWWLGTFPGLAVMSVVLAFNLVGDGVRDRIDPRTRGNLS